MIINMQFDALDSAMGTVSNIVSDRQLDENLKNVIIWVKDGQLRLAAYSGNIISATPIEAEIDYEQEVPVEYLAQLKAKEINDVLSSFKGLTRTKISNVKIHIEDTLATMYITESPVDETMTDADKYNQVCKFRLVKPHMKDLIRTKIQEIDMSPVGEEITTVDLLVYLNALLPAVSKQTRETNNKINFAEDDIYAFLQTHAALMPNKLPAIMSNFRLVNTVAAFIKTFITGTESFVLKKEEKGQGLVVLTIKANNSVAVIQCPDMSRAFDMTGYSGLPASGVAVDKGYLIDVLKRLSLTSEPASITITIGGGMGSMKVITKTMTQDLPVIQAKGEGTFSFSIKADLLSEMIFAHSSLDENVFIYLEQGERNITMGCQDNSQLWKTKNTGLAPSTATFNWS
jgi:hypothetical protein